AFTTPCGSYTGFLGQALLGGEPLTQMTQWYLYPEKPFIIVGTQDMLLSRALNRGYGSSPFMWPVEYGLLNNDCLWVMDEVQLMANGLPTSTQLAAFRQSFGTYGPCHTLWMSATVSQEWLHTVDFPTSADDDTLSLNPEDFQNDGLERRRKAIKLLHRLELPRQRRTRADQPYDYGEIAGAILERHQQGTLTLGVFNTVPRAQGVFQGLQDALKKAGGNQELLLVHSRFRLKERRQRAEEIGHDLPAAGRIVIATQAIEAGVDISARVLITDLAPWSSLVQRFGRCNRYGEFPQAKVFWLDLLDLQKHAFPYEGKEDSLVQARARLENMEGQSVAPASLPEVDETIRHGAVLRRRDLVSLFDTTPDLSGSYLDVSRFVRGGEDMDVQVFWRDWEGDPNERSPEREELCSVPVGQMKDFLSNRSRPQQAWRWDHLESEWQRIEQRDVRPGQTLLMKAEVGGYTIEKGWEPDSISNVPVAQDSLDEAIGQPPEGYDDERTNTGQRGWVTLRNHSLHVKEEAQRTLEALSNLALPEEIRDSVVTAAQWHDVGKAHCSFQEMLLQTLPESEEQSEYRKELWAKSGGRGGNHSRPYFRHEVASALVLLQRAPAGLTGWARDLAAYLAMSHHGRVRLSLRSLPTLARDRNRNPNLDYQYLLGFPIDANDFLPAADLGENVTVPETEIDMSISQMGIAENGERSWLDCSLSLRDSLGPFRLAYLEALIRTADRRASSQKQHDASEHYDC
ncbi:CRISPR-associated helicase Cas3', partial [Candidatus Saccharibacteria bacterium]|nr:CRISPR-associated helicase Cas3' [Candidatus Saccharibacteria bacterium]